MQKNASWLKKTQSTFSEKDCPFLKTSILTLFKSTIRIREFQKTTYQHIYAGIGQAREDNLLIILTIVSQMSKRAINKAS